MISGCKEPQQDSAVRAPEAFHKHDECHVCGMLIVRFPGPKGQAFLRNQATPLKFCSTRDLFAWLLQPETAAVVREIYVHDMALSQWEATTDNHLIDARTAWYVVGQRRRGAMGPTLASFASSEDAQAFARRYGGRPLRFQDITVEVMQSLQQL